MNILQFIIIGHLILGSYFPVSTNQFIQRTIFLQVNNPVNEKTLVQNSDKIKKSESNNVLFSASIDSWFLAGSVLVSFLALIFQLRKYKQEISRQAERYYREREDDIISNIRTSLIEIKTKILKLSYLIEHNIFIELDALCFTVVEKVYNHLATLSLSKEEEFIKSFFNKNLQRFLQSSIRNYLVKSEIRKEHLKELDEIIQIPSTFQFDMPLVTGIINDCLLILRTEMDYLTSDVMYKKLFPQEDYSEEHQLVIELQSIGGLENNDLAVFCRKINALLIKEAENVVKQFIKPIYKSTINIILILIETMLTIPEAELKRIKEWDHFLLFKEAEYSPIERIIISWGFFKDKLNGIVTELEQKAIDGDDLFVSICLEIKHILKNSGYYTPEDLYNLEVKYHELKDLS